MPKAIQGRLPAVRRPHEPIRILLREGKNQEAIARLRAILGMKPTDFDAKTLLFDAYFQSRDWSAALTVAQSIAEARPDMPLYQRWVISTLSNLKRYEDTIALANQFLERNGEDVDVLNTLKTAYFYVGKTEDAIQCGQRVMELWDAEVCRSVNAPVGMPAGRKGQDIIAFTLWGNAPIYNYGAMINLLLSRTVYPGWTCRYYVDGSVPRAVIDFLENEGGEVVDSSLQFPDVPGYFRRFLPFDDDGVTHVLVRDCDARLSETEAKLVAEWLASDYPFHVVRDHILHNDLMLAGLWGGRADCGMQMANLLREYFSFGPTNKYGHDQRMLAQIVWPCIRSRCLVHDKFYSLDGVRTETVLPPESHLGAGYQNAERVRREAASLGIPRIL